jgi:hypothetical protein
MRIRLAKSLAYAAAFAAGVAIFAAITLGQINRIDRRGTIADAQAMLEKTVVALKSNKTKTLDEINKIPFKLLTGGGYYDGVGRDRAARLSIADCNCCYSTFDHAHAFTGNASGISQSGPRIGYEHPRCREGSVLLSTVLPASRLPTLLLLAALLPPPLSLLGLWLAV